MKVYLVRSIETKLFEGVFWAVSLGDLWDTFDQYGDPYGFEFAQLKTCGAISVGAGRGRAIPQWHDMADEDVEDFDFSGFQADECLTEALYNQHELKWKPFCHASEGYGMLARIKAQVDAENDNADSFANAA